MTLYGIWEREGKLGKEKRWCGKEEEVATGEVVRAILGMGGAG